MTQWLTPHFAREEFDQPQRYGCPPTPYPAQWIVSRLLPLCQMLEELRRAIGSRRITILSGYRTEWYNRAVGGVPQSQHTEGRAADLAVAGLTAPDIEAEVSRLLQSGDLPLIRGVGLYPRFVHLDVREAPRVVVWRGLRMVT